MNTLPPIRPPAPASSSAAEHPSLVRVERLSHWLDEAIRIPGTRVKLGLEGLIGLVPGIGDIAGLLMGGYVVVEAHRIGAPTELKLRMLRNVATDALIGLVPVVGDVFDFAYRSNRRNVELLLIHYRPAPVPSPRLPPQRRWLVVLVLFAAVLGGWWFWHIV